MGLVCVIPAKGRSTRLPGKNGLRLGGVPLVARAVRVARDSALFESVVVSTDDDNLAALALEAGAEVPFRRDPALSRDPVEVDRVVQDALRRLLDRGGRRFEWVCTLQPSSPLRTVRDLRDSWTLVQGDGRADALVSVSAYAHHPAWALRELDGAVVPQRPEDAARSRSQLPELYHPDGCVYWQRYDDALRGRCIYAGRVLAYHTPSESAVDIDGPADLAFAEFLLQRRASGQAGS